MSSLENIKKMNTLLKFYQAAKRARAMNNPGGHPKDAEKGRVNHGPDAPACKRKKGCKCGGV